MTVVAVSIVYIIIHHDLILNGTSGDFEMAKAIFERMQYGCQNRSFYLGGGPSKYGKKKKGESNDIGLSNSLTQSGKLAELNMFSYPVLW